MTDEPPDRATDAEGVLRALAPLLRRVAGELELDHFGSSMVPTLPDGSTIRIQCANPEAVRSGDVVAVRTVQGLVTHRVVYRLRRGGCDLLLTRGDARWLPDAPITLRSVVGIVSQVQIDGTWMRPPAPPSPPGVARITSFVLRCLLMIHPGLARVGYAGMEWVRRLARAGRRARRSFSAD